MENITPIILAGGTSSRMGQDKAFVTLAQQPLIERVMDRLRQAFSRPPLLVTNRPSDYAHLGLRMVGDQVRGQGPLGGIYAGLCASDSLFNFVVACDMPFLNSAFLRYMAAQSPGYQVVMPRHGDATEALHAIYTKACIPHIEACLKLGQRRIISFLPQVTVRYIDKVIYDACLWGQPAFFNVNNRDDLVMAQRLWLKREKSLMNQGHSEQKEALS